MSKKAKAKVPSYFTEDERKLFKELNKDQKAHLQYMREDRAREYLYNCLKEKHSPTWGEIARGIADISESMFSETGLSKKASEEILQSKDHKCKFCGQAFRTEVEKEKHQKICL